MDVGTRVRLERNMDYHAKLAEYYQKEAGDKKENGENGKPAESGKPAENPSPPTEGQPAAQPPPSPSTSSPPRRTTTPAGGAKDGDKDKEEEKDPVKAQLHRLAELHAEVAKQINEALLADAAQVPKVSTPEIYRSLSPPRLAPILPRQRYVH
jgi:hypothetical protein